MSQQPFTAAALRGAVDLSSLKRPAPPAGPGSGGGAAPTTSGGTAGVIVEGSDAALRDIIAASARHPVVLVLWSSRLAESATFVATAKTVAQRYDGRFQLVTLDDGTVVDIAEACPVLLRWDEKVDADSRGAHLFREFARFGGLQLLVPFDVNDPLNTPHTLNMDDPRVLRALAQAVLFLRANEIPLDAAVRLTVDWYRRFHDGGPPGEIERLTIGHLRESGAVA